LSFFLRLLWEPVGGGGGAGYPPLAHGGVAVLPTM